MQIVSENKNTKFYHPLNPPQGLTRRGFSLVEMLMALLVASLLMTALAPIITRRFNENIHITGTMKQDGIKKNHEILFGSAECSEIKIDSTDGSSYCEGEFVVPNNYNGNMKVTVIGAGGGGGTAPTAGFTEYTTADSTGTFSVPAMTGKLEVTVIGGGDGGNGGQHTEKHETFVTNDLTGRTSVSNEHVTKDDDGTGNWDIPVAAQGKDMVVWACGGGGGGGGKETDTGFYGTGKKNAYGGGSGGYVDSQIVNFGNITSITYYIGGGGNVTWASLPFGGGASSTLAKQLQGTGTSGINFKNTNATLLTSNTIGGSAGTAVDWIMNSAICESVVGSVKNNYGQAGGNPYGGNTSGVHACNCFLGNAGGGGAASQIVTGTSGNYKIWVNAPGGGGGASAVAGPGISGACSINGNTAFSATDINFASGGGGGGAGGGAGGGSNNGYTGKGGTGGGNGSGYSAGTVPTVFGSRYCNGGRGGVYQNTEISYYGEAGKSGAIRIKYLDYSTGGIGGHSGRVLENVSKDVTEGTSYSVYIGKGAEGGKKGYIGNSGTDKGKTIPVDNSNTVGSATKIYTGSNNLIISSDGSYISGYGSSTKSGGNGGKVTTAFTTCTPGAGSASPSSLGGNATGYGCGGGGGYSLNDGGKGSGGYARIAWNSNWKAALDAYELAQASAGGGASGNVFTHTISVLAGQTIRVRIGKGGAGAYVLNNATIAATKGGDTVFGDSSVGEVKAGGGGAGGSVTVSSNNLVNGLGGAVSNICHHGSKSYLSKTTCIQGQAGEAGGSSQGGRGADRMGYGEGGLGGTAGDSSNGSSAASDGYGSGGGGAGIRNLGQVSSAVSANITQNPTKGGNGSNGKILLEWYEI